MKVRAVLDTNLVVSFHISRGEAITRLFTHWRKDNFTYIISPEIHRELLDVLNRTKLNKLFIREPEDFLDLVETETEWVRGELKLTGICRDPKDDKFIACAVEGNADYIVTGDKDLLTLESYNHIKMIRAYDFVQLLEEGPD